MDVLNELHLFAGAGGGILGGILSGHTTVCAVEIEPYPRKVLLQRQRDGVLPKFPIWDDIRTFDGTPWRGKVDIVAGGFPCQDISAAGKGAGIEGERSGLWGEMARVVGEVRPRFVFVENSPILTSRGLRRVLGELSELGYDARWCVLGASDVGAPHIRNRIWILAYPCNLHVQRRTSKLNDKKEWKEPCKRQVGLQAFGRWWERDPSEWAENCVAESRLDRVAHGVADRVDRLKAIGNGQVPLVAATAWTVLSEGLI